LELYRQENNYIQIRRRKILTENKKIVIIGAGPAGLATAYYLLKNTEYKPIIIEESGYIGGISRTHRYNGNRMDLGGHRFFTKNDEVMNLWKEIFPLQQMPAIDDIILDRTEKFSQSGVNPENDDEVFLLRNRLSRIYFLKKFFDYPISFKFETFKNLGIINLMKAGFGYLYSCVVKREEKSLEDFYINRFGKPLYEMFFEDYTEKLWGIHPSNIAPDWGAQRVKGLSLLKVLKNALLKPFISKKEVETSLIEEFMYPKFGPGQFYEALAEKIKAMGGTIIMNAKADSVFVENDCVKSVGATSNSGEKLNFDCDALFSSMPVKDLINAISSAPDKVAQVAQNLPYRDFMTVGLLVKKFAIKNLSKYKTVSDIIPDCWIYIQERNVKLGRLQIFNNWSPYLVKDLENTVSIGLEYFCNEGDDMWTMDDKKFIDFAIDELVSIGIINKSDVLDSTLVHVKKAYPAYFGAYKDFSTVREYIDSVNNLYCIGRNGQHRYNNMDHSILTGFEASRAFINGSDKSAIWEVNAEKEYHEEK